MSCHTALRCWKQQTGHQFALQMFSELLVRHLLFEVSLFTKHDEGAVLLVYVYVCPMEFSDAELPIHTLQEHAGYNGCA